MIYGIYAVRDAQTGYLSPFAEVNDGSAARGFEFAVLRQDDNLFFASPMDYSLYRIADYDTVSGRVTMQDHYPALVLNATSVVAKSKSVERGGDDPA